MFHTKWIIATKKLKRYILVIGLDWIVNVLFITTYKHKLLENINELYAKVVICDNKNIESIIEL